MAIPGALAPWVTQQFFDSDGTPLASGSVATYTAGTSTPAAVYTDSGLTTAHTNPILLGADGRPPSPIYIGPGGFKFVVMDADDVVLFTVDNVEDVGETWLARLGTEWSAGTKSATSGYAVVATDMLLTMNSTGGASPCVVQLPTAASRTTPITIKNIGTIALAVTPYASETIDGVAGPFTVPAASSPTCPSIWLVSDGISSWYILASHGLA